MNEFKTFIKYLFMPSGFLKDFMSSVADLFAMKRLSIIFVVVAAISLVLMPYNQKIVSGIFLFLAIFIQLRIIYKDGDHNRWRKEKIKNLSHRLVKKDASLLSGEHLETQSSNGEDNTGEYAVGGDNQPVDDKIENGK